MGIAELDGVSLYYETAGHGSRLLMISGTGSDLRRRPGPFGWPGADGFEVLAYDHRGLGQSIDHVAAQPTMATFAADALALVDHLGWDDFSIVGISFGGMVAQEVALAAGDRVRRLVLAVTSPGGAGGSSYPLHEMYALGPDERLAQMAAVLDTRTIDDERRRQALTDSIAADRAARPNAIASRGQMRQLQARSTHDTWDRLGELRVPTLVVAGRDDGIASLPVVTRLAEAIDGARLEVHNGGHGFLQRAPDAWAQITEFLLA